MWEISRKNLFYSKCSRIFVGNSALTMSKSSTEIDALLQKAFEGGASDLKELFDEKLKGYNLTRRQALNLLDIDHTSLTPILSGEAKQINLINILKIASFLELEIAEILPAVLGSQPKGNFAKLDKVNRVSFLAKNFDIERLHKIGFLKKKDDTDAILERILTFFGFNNIIEYKEYGARVEKILFSQTKRSFTTKMRDFSVIAAYRLFELINNPNDYDRKGLLELIPKIKPYCQDVENGLLTVCMALYKHGVTVAFQTSLPTSQYRGGTFFVNDKPCIILTDVNKVYPTIWFALLHELYHVLFDEEDLRKSIYHLTGEPSIFLIDETKPNDFARDFFFDETMFEYIKPFIHNKIIVNRFAKENSIEPSLVYSFFAYYMNELEGKNYYPAFKDCFPDIKLATKRLNPITWSDSKTIKETVELIKSTFELTV